MTVNDIQNPLFPFDRRIMIRQATTGFRLVIATSQRDAVVRLGNTWHQPSPQTHQIYITLVALIHQVHNRCIRITSVAKHTAGARWSSNPSREVEIRPALNGPRAFRRIRIRNHTGPGYVSSS